MGTIAENILSIKVGREISVDEIVEVDIDYVMVNDITGLPAFEIVEELGATPLKEKIVLIPDHYVPNKDIPSAEQAKKMREFARKHRIKSYFEVGRGGVCHQVMVEQGFVAPGRVIVGADSHTCTYGALNAFSTGIGSTEAAYAMIKGKLWFRVPETVRFTVDGIPKKPVCGKDIILKIIGDVGVDGALYMATEFHGTAFNHLALSDRLTVANMAIEMGAKTGIFPPDEKVFNYLKNRVIGGYRSVHPDKDAEYKKEFFYNAEEIAPMVAKPSSPANVVPVEDIDVAIDQAYLGSCTNGRIEDMRVAAEILKGKKVHEDVRLIVVPASMRVYREMLKEGLIDIFVKAGAFVSGPTCGACLGGYMGVLAEGEVCVSSTNRNFIGRMGHKDSKVYLASPATVAISAVEGKITDPREFYDF